MRLDVDGARTSRPSPAVAVHTSAAITSPPPAERPHASARSDASPPAAPPKPRHLSLPVGQNYRQAAEALASKGWADAFAVQVSAESF